MKNYPAPSSDCPFCPRLKAFRDLWRSKEPSWFNSPVPPFYPINIENTRFLIVGLAPGLQGANRTGRPFTGDYAGELFYQTLNKFNFSQGIYKARIDDSLQLCETLIVNSVRCVPPQNKPIGEEINNCRQFFSPFLKNLPNLQVILTLGTIAHQSTIRALGKKVSEYKFKHNIFYDIDNLRIFSSYHCSRYNTNTNRLTTEMFEAVFQAISSYLKEKNQ